MSEVKLNLVDAERVLHGTIHGSVVDSAWPRCRPNRKHCRVEAALARYHNRTMQGDALAGSIQLDVNKLFDELWFVV